MTSDMADDLADMEIFDGCPPEQLRALALRLRPLRAEGGQILMREGEQALSFILIRSGSAEIRHVAEDGAEVVGEVAAGSIVGEIALLRAAPRTATVTALGPLSGFVGDEAAFAEMVELEGVGPRLVRLARQRLAAFVTPIEVRPDDESVLLLRPVLPGDSEETSRPTVEFSKETLYRRFMSARPPSSALMNYLFEVDYVDHFVWVLSDGDDGPVVADARFVRDADDATAAEVAFIVADDYQGHGIGSFLMEALILAAHVAGIRRFTARLLAENAPMRTILDRFGGAWEHEEPGVLATEFAVPRNSELHIDPVMAAQIRAMARQVMRAVS